MASAEREFHRALAALRRLQKDRGFVPQPAASEDQIGFVPSETRESSPEIVLLDPNPEAFYHKTGFRTSEELRAHLHQIEEHSKAA